MTAVRPLRADAARNRVALLGAAREAFILGGVTASLEDVARAAGVGPGTLYRHFPSRDALVLAVIDDGLIELNTLGIALLDSGDPLQSLRRWLEAYIAQAGLFDGLAKTLVAARYGASAACELARDAGAALLTRAIEAGAVRAGVDIVDVLDLAAAIAWVGEQPERSEAQRARLLGFVLDGLGKS